VALDATGVGAVAGVPLNAVAAAGIATGATMTGVAVANIASNAARDDHVSPMNTSDSPGTGGGPTPETPPGVKAGMVLTHRGQRQRQRLPETRICRKRRHGAHHGINTPISQRLRPLLL
jgi:hypothetical protein